MFGLNDVFIESGVIYPQLTSGPCNIYNIDNY